MKGPGVLAGYRGDAEATAATLTDDGWLRTGDLARLGPRDVVFFAGRKKDVIKHGGYSVYAVEIEQALEQHPDVVEAAVVGLPDERKGELPAAVVRLADGATLDEDAMRAWAAERLSDYKVPGPHRRRRRPAPHRHQQGPAQGAPRPVRYLIRPAPQVRLRRSGCHRERCSAWRTAQRRSAAGGGRRGARDVAGLGAVVVVVVEVVVVVRAAKLRSTSTWPSRTCTR